MKPVIAIVGRPNVGKSTLFNRLARRRKAIVEDQPGVTRDRNYAEVDLEGRSVLLIDTGGFEPEAKERISQQVREQVEMALEEADGILFLMDGREGLNPLDIEIAQYLRKIAKPVFYVVNKIDGERLEDQVPDFYRLGVAPIYSISAAHGRGVSDLIADVMKGLPSIPDPAEGDSTEAIRVALVGRPNVGKSSLLNRLIGRPRMIVDDAPGTTRDAIDTFFSYEGKNYIFIDTAGIRRKTKVSARLEKYTMIQALKSIERCQVAIIVLDGFQGLTEQDVRIAEFAEERGRCMLFAVNKWDLVQKDGQTSQRYVQRIHEEAKTLSYVPILFISARTGQRVKKIFPAIQQVIAETHKRVATAELNEWLQAILSRRPPPHYQNRAVKIYYATQVSVGPPTFVFFTNQPQGVDPAYQRYLTHQLRDRWGFEGTPLRLFFRHRTPSPRP